MTQAMMIPSRRTTAAQSLSRSMKLSPSGSLFLNIDRDRKLIWSMSVHLGFFWGRKMRNLFAFGLEELPLSPRDGSCAVTPLIGMPSILPAGPRLSGSWRVAAIRMSARVGVEAARQSASAGGAAPPGERPPSG